MLSAATGLAHAGTLDQVKTRGYINCGVNPGLAGFGLADSKGEWAGHDVDVCKAVAAAVFGDTTKVRFLPMTGQNRYTALQAGEIDLLSRNSTWTMTNESKAGVIYTAVHYYDGQGFIVRKAANVASAKKLNGASVCVLQGTTTELNLADYARTNKLKLEPVAFGSLDEAVKAYETGRCDALTTDASGLYSLRLRLADPSLHVVLPDVISKEPLSPVVRQGDDTWLNIVKWTQFALINAEELEITKANVDSMLTSQNPPIRRLLGVEGDFGSGLGLNKDWALQAIRAVGNYGEIFDRNIGAGSPLKIERGLNALWSKGGLLYAPPVR
jgi:general L-amino acid transport system substrate-binding protein